MYRISSLLNTLQDRWENASPTDFGSLALAVIITAWFIGKYCSR